ncbi:MAG: hypothetical protein LBS04_01420, partial [Tannerellaceae bacterium]|nr:hypothetical protein [Tannerellaceae bacterium]
ACQEKALAHFSITKDTTGIGMTLRNIGRIYSKSGALDSAVVYYSKAILYLSKQSCSSIYNEIGDLYLRLEEYSTAFKYIRLAFKSLTEENEKTPLYLNLGDFYRKTGQYDSAHYYLSLAGASPNMYTKAGATLSLSYLEEERQNYSTSLMLRERYLQLQDSIRTQERSETLQRIQSLYKYNRIEKERFALKREANQRTLQLYTSLLIFFVCIFILTIFFQRINRINRDRYETELRLLEQKQYEKTQEHLVRQKEMIDLFKESPLYKKIEAKDRLSDDDWEELQKEIESVYQGFTAHVKKLLPDADITDLRLCYLTKINISSVQIACLLCLVRSTITKKKQVLYKKINGVEGKAKDFDIFMVNFR